MEINLTRTSDINIFNRAKDGFESEVEMYLLDNADRYKEILTYGIEFDYPHAKTVESIYEVANTIKQRANDEVKPRTLLVANFTTCDDFTNSSNDLTPVLRIGPGTGLHVLINIDYKVDVQKSNSFNSNETETLKPYLVKRTDRIEYGEDIEMVVVARSEADAIIQAIAKSEDFREDSVTVSEVNLSKRGVILVRDSGA